MIRSGDRKRRWSLFFPAMLLISIIIATLPVSSPASARIESTEGGTDENIGMMVVAGGSGETTWNSLHGFVIIENETKADVEFNITISKEIDYNTTRDMWSHSGYIFGGLERIRWDDDPEPFLDISQEDFEEHSEDGFTLTVMVLGEYYRNNGNDSELRQVYKEVVVQRPNRSPVPAVHLTVANNWSWIEATEGSVIRMTVGAPTEDVNLNFTGSYDPDVDEITYWRCLVHGIDILQGFSELPGNVTVSLKADEQYSFQYECSDAGGEKSKTLSFMVLLLYDLQETNLEIVDLELNETLLKTFQTAIINLSVGNIGNNQALNIELVQYVNGDQDSNVTIETLPPGENLTVPFQFMSRSAGSFNVSYVLRDNGKDVGRAFVPISVWRSRPFVNIESPRNNSNASDVIHVQGTVNFDHDQYSQVSIELSVDGGAWMWVANSTEGKYWQFNLTTALLGNGSHRIGIRAFDGLLYSDERSLMFTVITNSTDARSDSSRDTMVIVSGIIVIGSLGLLGLGFLRENVRFNLHSLFSLPLYSKLHRHDILKQGNRLSVYEFILQNPGTNVSTLYKRLDIGYGTLVHHLTMLERSGLIHSRKEAGKRMFISTGQDWGPARAVATIEGLSPIQRRILDHLKDHGPRAQWQMETELGLSKQTVSYSIRRLEDSGLVHCDGAGKGSLCHAPIPGTMKQDN